MKGSNVIERKSSYCCCILQRKREENTLCALGQVLPSVSIEVEARSCLKCLEP